MDEPYTTPALQFFDFYKGTKAAGELIAAFELIELDYSGYLEVTGLQETAQGCQLSGESCVARSWLHRDHPVESHIWLSAAGTEPMSTGRGGRGPWCGVEMAFTAWYALASPLQPSVPEDVEPKELGYLGDPRAGRFIIPEGIRPVLKEFRIEVRCLLRVTAWLACAEGRELDLELKCTFET